MAEASDDPAMDQSGKSAHYLLTANEREYLAKLCWLLHDAGTHALRVTFDAIHPPLVLKEHLAQAHIKTMLNKLHQQKVLSEKQWKGLYPPKQRGVTSQKYDSKLLSILLQTICHLCPPYPNGWSQMPLGTDSSLSSDVVRLSILFQQIGSLGGVRDEEYPVLWKQIGEVLLRLAGPPARVKIHRIDNESVPPDTQGYYINLIKEQWAPDEKGMFSFNLDSVRNRSTSKSPHKKRGRDKTKDEEGLPPEDAHVLMKMYKMLTENVIAEDIMDRLQQGQIIKIGDRQEIMSLGKNTDRMQLILDKILNSKINYAFKLLCDALKFKYPKEYDIVMKTRKATYKQGIVETIDLVTVCQEELCAQYKSLFSRCCPVPWLDNIYLSVRDFYAPVDVVDSEGKKLHLSDMLPAQSNNGRGRRVVLEGASGSGQTTLSKVLAYTWATQRHYFKSKYDFVVHIDAQAVGGDMYESIHKRVLPENTKLSAKDFWSLMEANVKDVLFIIDGFNGTSSSSDLNQLIQGSKFKTSSVLLLVTPELHLSKYVVPDEKLFNIGLGVGSISRCFKTYGQLLDLSQEESEGIAELLQTPEWVFKDLLTSPFLCLAVVMVFKMCKETSVRDVVTVTELFEAFGEAIAKNFCIRQNIDVSGNEFPDEVLNTIGQLEELAFESVSSKKTVFKEEELLDKTRNVMTTKFGALVKTGTNGKWKMTCSLLTDFLAARFLANMTMEEMVATLHEQRFLGRAKHANLISFLCGLFRNDHDTQVLENLFLELKNCNIKVTKGFQLSLDGNTSPEKGSTTNHLTSGFVMDFLQSFESLSESDFREDAAVPVVDSMPNHLIIRRDGMLPYSCLNGLRSVLLHETVNITHIEVNLLPVYMLQTNIYFKLAEAISGSPKLRRLRVLWHGLELMAQFLAIATRDAHSLQSVQIEDCSKKIPKQVSAAAWSGLQEFCNNMASVKKFVFLNCKMASVIQHILHHLPVTLEDIDFAGCSMNPICAGEVATKIEHSKGLKRLNLSNTRLETSDVKALTQGVKLGESLEELSLGGSRLDRSGVVALAESIRLSNSIQCLDLSNSELTTELCMILAEAIAQSRTFNKLVVVNAKMTSEGRLYISQAKDNDLQIVGLKTLKYISPV